MRGLLGFDSAEEALGAAVLGVGGWDAFEDLAGGFEVSLFEVGTGEQILGGGGWILNEAHTEGGNGAGGVGGEEIKLAGGDVLLSVV